MKIGIALGGGGTKGFAHIGVLKALYERGIEPTIFSGTSAGSIVAALLASGKTPDQTFDVLKDIKITEASKIKIPINGFASLEKLKDKLDEILEEKNFSDLKYPLYIGATNLNKGTSEYWKCSKSVSSLIFNSCSIYPS